MPAVTRPRVDLDSNYLLTERGSFKLTRQEAEFVYILATRAPAVVLHDTTFNGLWGLSTYQPVDPLGELHVIVVRARRKIAGSGWSIVNAWHGGYRLAPDDGGAA